MHRKLIVCLSPYQNAGHHCKVKMANKSFEYVAKLKYVIFNTEFGNHFLTFSSEFCVSISYLRTHTIILPNVLYVCENWCLTLKEEHKLMVFNHRVLRRIFGPNIKLHSEAFHNLYSSPCITQVIK
jgi:hypothetical protein